MSKWLATDGFSIYPFTHLPPRSGHLPGFSGVAESMSDRPYIVLRRARSGQTLIVAVAVLFILLVIGALFITQIARNLTFAGRSRDTQLADSLARAGVQFCDQQLSYSEEGADWRPVPTAP